jgi:hypothetical protein
VRVFGAKALSHFATNHSLLTCITTSAMNPGGGRVPACGREVFKEPYAVVKGLLKEIEDVTLCSWSAAGEQAAYRGSGEAVLE